MASPVQSYQNQNLPDAPLRLDEPFLPDGARPSASHFQERAIVYISSSLKCRRSSTVCLVSFGLSFIVGRSYPAFISGVTALSCAVGLDRARDKIKELSMEEMAIALRMIRDADPELAAAGDRPIDSIPLPSGCLNTPKRAHTCAKVGMVVAGLVTLGTALCLGFEESS